VIEPRIRELVQDLTPVKPIPQLRSAALGLLAIFAGVLVADWALGGAEPRPFHDAAWGSPWYLAALAGVTLLAFGALASALASAVPGRAASTRMGLQIAGVGIGLAFAGWLLGLASGAPDHGGETLRAMTSCGSRALVLGLVPALGCAVFAVRAALRRGAATAALSLLAGMALGAAAVQISCPSNSPVHQLVGHLLAPALVIALLTAPVARIMERSAHRD
jgi:hypothetical protein